MSLKLNYFNGDEAEQYSFYRIPKTLFSDARYKTVPVEAKVLYGLLLDRMSLSARNGWMDENNHVYIYFTMEDAMAQLGCGKDKIVKLFKALDTDTGIGLIERRKQGQGRPARIYVKNFILPVEPDMGPSEPEPEPPEPEPHINEGTLKSAEMPMYGTKNQASEKQTSEKQKSESGENAEKSVCPHHSGVQTSEKQKSGRRKIRSPDSGKTATNNTDKNNTEKNDTDNQSIHLSSSLRGRVKKPKIDKGLIASYRGLIRQNIEYYDLLKAEPSDKDILDGYVELMVDVCCGQGECVRINGENMPREVVKSRFLKLDREHINYVKESLRKNTTDIKNIKAYTLTALYNAPTTLSQYYTSEISRDMAAGFI